LVAATQSAQISLFKLLIVVFVMIDTSEVKADFPVWAICAFHIFLLRI